MNFIEGRNVDLKNKEKHLKKRIISTEHIEPKNLDPDR